MGDADNTLPPSKKRAAGRELSRDNPGLDDEEEVPGQETGTFKRASEEVLANRRIVKVRRSQTSTAPSAAPPSSNPFASIRLIPTADSTAATPAATPPPSNPFASICLIPTTNSTAVPAAVNDSEEIEKTASGEVKSPDSVNKKTEKVEDEEKGGASEVRKPEPTEEEEETPKVADSEAQQETEKKVLEGNGEKNTEAEKETEEKVLEGNGEKNTEAEKEAEKNVLDGSDEKNTEGEKDTENEAKIETENKDAATSVNSFQQLSSSQNAFTGLVGTGFSSSTFSFGSISKTDPPSFPSFSFGTNGNSALFGNPPGASLGEKTEGTKIPSMQEVHVETGEENEMAVFTADAALFEFLDGGWKERGKGELKVNVLTTGTKKARLVMRARGNYRLILNASIFPDMKLTNMEKKGITFACLNSTGEGQNGLSTFALKFKDAAIVDEFRSVVAEHKGSAVAVSVPTTMKTPENSPKASDE